MIRNAHKNNVVSTKVKVTLSLCAQSTAKPLRFQPLTLSIMGFQNYFERRLVARKDHLTSLKISFVVVVVLLFYVHGKHLRSCRGGQLT